MNKALKVFANIGLTACLLGVFLFPFVLPLRLTNQVGLQDDGLVLGVHTSNDYSNYLVYTNSGEFFGKSVELTAYGFPGQKTVYHNVLEVKNTSSEPKKYTLSWEVVGDCLAQPTFYFGSNTFSKSEWLIPESIMFVHLQLDDSFHKLTSQSACKLVLKVGG